MKKFIILISIISLLFVTACSSNDNQIENSTNNDQNESIEEVTDEDQIIVYTSFITLYDFASKIGGDKAEVINLMPQGGDPHHWEPTASDISNLEEGDIFIYNGLSLEHWVDSVLSSIGNDDLLVLEASEGVDAIESTHSHDHGHDHDDEHDHNHAHDDDHDHDHEHHEHSMDPHVWQDPARAKIMLENIKQVFIEANPDNEEYYEDNFKTYAEELDKLDEEYRESLEGLESRDLVVSHEAFGYLSEAYDLNQIGVEGLIPDSEPSPSRMAEIIDYINDNDISAIFYEDPNNSNVAETIAQETGTTVEILYTLEILTDDQISNEDDYFSVMRQNLETLKNALE